MFQRILTAVVATVLFGCTAGGDSATAQELETDEQRTLYALGVVLASNIDVFALTREEVEFVAMGLREAVAGDPSRVDIAVFGPRIQQLADARSSAASMAEKEASAAFAAEIAQEPGAQVFDSGLVFVPMVEGSGESPTASDTVRVHYHGTLRDGTVFDSSVDRGESITFPLDGVIPCWTEGVQKMRVGGKAKLACPSEIAYGESGTGPIPGGATLLFEVELLGIE
ncbi:MAG: FKBP-type peptidyl-prolyl cis-trans isomerase [Gammaproteobacteria bacterium]|jgi:FKBP-type peptidyl-prolyl cis-trans isomerase